MTATMEPHQHRERLPRFARGEDANRDIAGRARDGPVFRPVNRLRPCIEYRRFLVVKSARLLRRHLPVLEISGLFDEINDLRHLGIEGHDGVFLSS
jgi:hypothetical protein